MSTLTPAQHTAVRVAYTAALKEDMIVCCVILVAGLLLTLPAYDKARVSMKEKQRLRVLEEQQRRQLSKRPPAGRQVPAPETAPDGGGALHALV